MINVLIVEDSRISRDSFVRQLALTKKYNIVAAIENAANAEIACIHNKIDLVLMDVCTADDESGLEAAAKIKKHCPSTKVVIMTSMPEYSFLHKARASGCDGFWYKEYSKMDLLEVCDRTVNGESVWPEKRPSIRIGLATSDEFTSREMDVIRCIAQGMRYDEIAGHLCMSVNTVKYHIRNILQKTGFRSTVRLISEVVEQRLVLPKY